MIEIGKNFLWGVQQAKQTAQQQKANNKTLAQQMQAQADALQQNYEAHVDYLFRSAAEKTQLATAAARQQLAALQAKRAANGVNDTSASVREETQTAALNAQQQHAQTQAALQTQAAQAERSFAQTWQALLRRAAQYAKQAKRKNRLGSLGAALTSLFK